MNDDQPFPSLVTTRLRIRLLKKEDREFLARLDADPAVMRFVHSGPIAQHRALLFADSEIKGTQYRRHFHKYLVESLADQESLGWVQICKYEQESLRGNRGDDIQIGYEFAPEHWGFGYATEAAREVIKFIFANHSLDRLVAFARPENLPSLRVLVKLGFSPIDSCTDDGRHLCIAWALDRPAD